MNNSEETIAISVVGMRGSGAQAAIGFDEREMDVLTVGTRPIMDAHSSLAVRGHFDRR